MNNYIKLFLSFLYFKKVKSKFTLLDISDPLRVLFWRIRPYGANCLVVGQNSTIESKVVYERAGAMVSVGDRTFIGAGTITVAKSVEIGNDVMMAWGVCVSDHDSHSTIFNKRKHDVTNWLNGVKDWTNVACGSVKICNKAWVGFNTIILKGVTVGEGAVIGAGSVVTKDVPPWTIVAGNPARFIREIPDSER